MGHTSANLPSRIWIRFASCLPCSSFLKRLVCFIAAEMLASSDAFSSLSFRRDFLNRPETPATKNRPARCCANLSFFGYRITVGSKRGKSVILVLKTSSSLCKPERPSKACRLFSENSGIAHLNILCDAIYLGDFNSIVTFSVSYDLHGNVRQIILGG
jgi:hypothetical protein